MDTIAAHRNARPSTDDVGSIAGNHVSPPEEMTGVLVGLGAVLGAALAGIYIIRCLRAVICRLWRRNVDKKNVYPPETSPASIYPPERIAAIVGDAASNCQPIERTAGWIRQILVSVHESPEQMTINDAHDWLDQPRDSSDSSIADDVDMCESSTTVGVSMTSITEGNSRASMTSVTEKRSQISMTSFAEEQSHKLMNAITAELSQTSIVSNQESELKPSAEEDEAATSTSINKIYDTGQNDLPDTTTISSVSLNSCTGEYNISDKADSPVPDCFKKHQRLSNTCSDPLVRIFCQQSKVPYRAPTRSRTPIKPPKITSKQPSVTGDKIEAEIDINEKDVKSTPEPNNDIAKNCPGKATDPSLDESALLSQRLHFSDLADVSDKLVRDIKWIKTKQFAMKKHRSKSECSARSNSPISSVISIMQDVDQRLTQIDNVMNQKRRGLEPKKKMPHAPSLEKVQTTPTCSKRRIGKVCNSPKGNILRSSPKATPKSSTTNRTGTAKVVKPANKRECPKVRPHLRQQTSRDPPEAIHIAEPIIEIVQRSLHTEQKYAEESKPNSLETLTVGDLLQEVESERKEISAEPAVGKVNPSGSSNALCTTNENGQNAIDTEMHLIDNDRQCQMSDKETALAYTQTMARELTEEHPASISVQKYDAEIANLPNVHSDEQSDDLQPTVTSDDGVTDQPLLNERLPNDVTSDVDGNAINDGGHGDTNADDSVSCDKPRDLTENRANKQQAELNVDKIYEPVVVCNQPLCKHGDGASAEKAQALMSAVPTLQLSPYIQLWPEKEDDTAASDHQNNDEEELDEEDLSENDSDERQANAKWERAETGDEIQTIRRRNTQLATMIRGRCFQGAVRAVSRIEPTVCCTSHKMGVSSSKSDADLKSLAAALRPLLAARSPIQTGAQSSRVPAFETPPLRSASEDVTEIVTALECCLSLEERGVASQICNRSADGGQKPPWRSYGQFDKVRSKSAQTARGQKKAPLPACFSECVARSLRKTLRHFRKADRDGDKESNPLWKRTVRENPTYVIDYFMSVMQRHYVKCRLDRIA